MVDLDASAIFRQILAERPARVWQPSKSFKNCVHRGAETRRIECKSCKGTVKLKVFACAVHGECMMNRSTKGVKQCAGCADATEVQAYNVTNDGTD
jgi:hypothetical protein